MNRGRTVDEGDLPDHFVCATCQQRLLLDVLCLDASTIEIHRCVYCCGCLAHAADADPGGRVVWDRHGWRGLDDSPEVARRHP